MKAFETVHPMVAMFYFVLVLIIAMFTSHPILYIEALAGALCFCFMLERKKTFIKGFAFYIPVFIIIALTNPLFSHNGVTPLFFMNGNPVTLEALLYGVAAATMLIAVMYWCKCYSIIMTTDKFLYLFGKAVPKLSLVLSMALRFIPMFKRRMKQVRHAQKAMGMYSGKGYFDKLRASMSVFYALIAWSLENSVETGNSMRARGYGLKGRTHFSLFKFTRRDGIFALITAIAFTVLLAGIIAGGADFNFYPKITSIDTGLLAILVYISFGIITFLPFILEVEENLKWTYLKSKI